MNPNDPRDTELDPFNVEHRRLMDAAKDGKLSDELQEVACEIFDVCARSWADMHIATSTVGTIFANRVAAAINAAAKRGSKNT
jgi:hypothetical protein